MQFLCLWVWYRMELLVHEEQVHKISKFSCHDCKTVFQSLRRLNEHRQHKHSETNVYTCDRCGCKCTTLEELDKHIQTSHSNHSRKNIDIRDVRNKEPCNPADPRHSTRCCDRKPRTGYESKSFTETEKERNGPCRQWNNGHCSFSESCKFAHLEICRFQEICFYGPSECRFFHFRSKEQEKSFLEARTPATNPRRRR